MEISYPLTEVLLGKLPFKVSYICLQETLILYLSETQEVQANPNAAAYPGSVLPPLTCRYQAPLTPAVVCFSTPRSAPQLLSMKLSAGATDACCLEFRLREKYLTSCCPVGVGGSVLKQVPPKCLFTNLLLVITPRPFISIVV